MHFHSVRAAAFGGFRDEELAFAPGLNVIVGVNEAGKSTWHAAMYAALCGMRRGKGPMQRSEARFEEKHRPWSGEETWQVEAIIELADGRRVSMRRDLARKLDRAEDADVAGMDYSSEILFDGAPDGARWLGLNRGTFLHTACVRQAEVLALRDGAGTLREALQAAAATATRDATAARALDTLREYRSETIGSERAWTKPLVRSRDEAEQAKDGLIKAREAIHGSQGKRSRLEVLERDHERARLRADAARALELDAAADHARSRLLRAEQLAREFPNGAPPLLDDHIRDQVVAALAHWEMRSVQPDAPSRELLVGLQERRQAFPTRAVAVSVLFAATLSAGLWSLGSSPIFSTLAGLFSMALTLPILWHRHSPNRHQPSGSDASERESPVNTASQHQADSALARAAEAAGIVGESPEEVYEGLRAWLPKHGEQAEAAIRRWSELQQVLDGNSLMGLAAKKESLAKQAQAAIEHADPEALDQVLDDGASLVDLELDVQRVRDLLQAETARWSMTQDSLPDLAAAEERLAAAGARHNQLLLLDQTLATTIEYLGRAEERVHRDIARILRRTLIQWLPMVTGGRYEECRVDPASLEVEVRRPDGNFQSAELLSHGTAEQVYLLLRLALSKRLTRLQEPCPLVLDDIFAGCDRNRTNAILDTLLAMAEETQVVVFTHDEAVLTWAQRSCLAPQHRCTVLDGPA